MWRTDIKLHAARYQNVIRLAEPGPQVRALGSGITGIRHFDIITNDQVRPTAGQVRPDAPRQHGGITQFL